MHFVLIGLNGDARQRGITLDAHGLAQMTVTGGKAVLEELEQVDLAAGFGEQIEILVVDVNIAAVMRVGNVLIQNVAVHKIFGAFRTVLEHGSHRRIGVDIGVFALDVGILRVYKGKRFEDIHQILFGLTELAAFGAIENVCFGGFGQIVRDEHFLHDVLHLFHRGRLPVGNLFHHLIGQRHNAVLGERFLFYRVACLSDGFTNLCRVERNGLTASLDNILRMVRQTRSLLKKDAGTLSTPCTPLEAPSYGAVLVPRVL